MADSIRHREVFPEGSSPDSIDWRVWNDAHGLDDGSGGFLLFGPIADGEFLKRVGDEIVGAAVSGGGTLFVKRVTFSDFVAAAGIGGYVPTWHTLEVGETLTYAGIEIVEVFDDSATGAFDLNVVDGPGNILGNIVAVTNPSIANGGLTSISTFGLIGGDGPPFPADGNVLTALRATVPTLISPMLVGWADDGTTGIADIYLRIETASPL